MENGETTVHYVFAHSKIPDIIFNNYSEFLKIATKGPAVLSSYLEAEWNLVKKDLNTKTKLKVLDNDLRVDLYSFQISVINTKKKKRILNIIMPPISQYTETRFITIVLEKEPQFFTCELSKSFNKSNSDDYYVLGEWKHDKKKSKFTHIDHGKIEEFSLGKYFSKIEEKIK